MVTRPGAERGLWGVFLVADGFGAGFPLALYDTLGSAQRAADQEIHRHPRWRHHFAAWEPAYSGMRKPISYWVRRADWPNAFAVAVVFTAYHQGDDG